MSMSKEVCDIQGCDNKTDTVIVLQSHENYTEVAMCSQHYHDFNSKDGPAEITYDMKDNINSKYKYN
jgi:hypothetical protein